MGYCKADDAQICEDCGALIADGYWPEHTRFHEVVTSLSLDALKRLKQSSGEKSGERSLMDDLPPRVRPWAAAIGIPDRPVDLRERAREWIEGFHEAAEEDRVNCVALMLDAADAALRCAVNHKPSEYEVDAS